MPSSSTTASTGVTTTSIPQPSGRSIILQIQAPTTNRRRNIKRAPVGGFVGGSQGYFKPLSEQKPINNGGDIITKTFTVSNGVLVFKNSSLPTGEAGFCQTSNGIVYITFSSQPSGCVPVALRIYEVQQCQNGRIIDGSTTSSFATTTVSSDLGSEGTPSSTLESTSDQTSDSTLSSTDLTTSATSSSDSTTGSASSSDLTSTDSTSSTTSSETSATTSATPPLVQDGGFEDNPNTAWALSGSAAIVNDPSTAHTGDQYLQLSVVNGLPSQTGLVSSPNSMRLSYVVMDSPTPSGVSQCSFRVMTAGNLVAAFDVDTTPGVWQSESFSVWGSGSSWTIEVYLYCFQGPATFAIGVDNVSIQ
ncbi:hypothetical protein FGLOB1_1551 [Fusarium globosum]|uniref:DUF7908 domain-containing protein n=1 Tax=Fusarium globosum TaxID=78864 RepID=A0A8H5YU44_9HYPO|nr:hypothetical protein FGLOB1_1551 [Fusarium globosum]